MPTAVEHGIGVEAIIAVLRKAGGDPDLLPAVQDVGHEFGQALMTINFAMPTDQHLGLEMKGLIGLLLPAVQHNETVDLLGVQAFTPHDGFFVI